MVLRWWQPATIRKPVGGSDVDRSSEDNTFQLKAAVLWIGNSAGRRIDFRVNTSVGEGFYSEPKERWFKSSLRNQSNFAFSYFRKPCNQRATTFVKTLRSPHAFLMHGGLPCMLRI